MGRSSPPFIYDRPAICGVSDHAFNPKAVTQASWTPAPRRPAPTGPLVKLDRHPDSYASIGKSNWTPMSPHTKRRVKYARSTQLCLRILALLGALGSLFCSIIITNVPITVIWIIRAGPIVAVLHTIYGIYHLSRSPIRRPPASQAVYGLFASTLDAGLIPFYVFTVFMAYGEYTTDAYNWGTLFPSSSNLTTKVAKGTFICGVANAALHLISLSISIFLAVMFRKISHLPPDMNPLEDNLTARPQKERKQLGSDEKHMSRSTLNSTLEDPLIDPPRLVPFMHTRGQSIGGDSHSGSVDVMKRQSQGDIQAQQLPHMEPMSPETLFHHHHPANQPYDLQSATPAPEFCNVSMRSPEIVNPSIHTRQLTSRAADRSDTVSPLSDNWVAYSDRSPSPESERNGENATTLRQSSSVYSRRTNMTSTSNGSGIRDWFVYGQRSGPNGGTIPEDTRGEYESLAMHEYYGIDDDHREQDLGDRRINIFPDPTEHDHENDDGPPSTLPFNPLKLNPPSPQPALDDGAENTDPVRRVALSDNPNLSHSHRAQVFAPPESPSSPPIQRRFYEEVRADENPELGIPYGISDEDYVKPSTLSKERSKKSAYQSLKKDDSDDEDAYLTSKPLSSPAMTEGDRKGRVVSNSGADTARPGIGFGVGASLSSYGSYIAGLGVGRRRDVSGKVAEEGRGAKSQDEHPPQNKAPEPIRAAGWARFAGL